MSLLAPLYFLGALAVGLPLLFHLIRRQPKSRLAFSSLMFLRPSPPRLTRRSRLDNLPLLLMRALALVLIAAAFARPFLRSPVQTTAQREGRHVLLLVDTSASMQRDGLWPQAIAAANEVLDELQPQDQVGLMAFDRRPQMMVAFADEGSGNDGTGGTDAQLGVAAVRQSIADLRPTWQGGDLGLALSSAADTLNALSDADAAGKQRTELVLISDMQAGAATDSLQGYAWPPDVQLAVRTVGPERTTNASALIMAEDPLVGQAQEGGDEAPTRVRVANAADSQSGQFQLQWADASGKPLSRAAPRPVNVPPGEVRVVQMPQPTSQRPAALVLSGDDHPFDNIVYMAVPEPAERKLVFVGDDPTDPRDSLLYYLRQTSLDTLQQTITVEHAPTDEPLPPLAPEQTALVVVAAAPSDAAAPLRRFLEEGGKVWLVLSQPAADQPDAEPLLRALSGEPQVTVEEAEVDEYALLGSIDFTDSLFSIFADPRFSDFSKIRFWSHRRVDVPDSPDWHILARFDDGSPAIVRRPVGEGQLLVLASGWQPNVSQLALSTKFVPLVARLIDPDAGERSPQPSYAVGDPINLPDAQSATLTTPDGSVHPLDGEAAGRWIDRPGIYRLAVGDTRTDLAVNVPPAESRTEPLEPAQLEQLGVPLTAQVSAADREALERQMRDIELEQRQQWWRWLMVAALVLLAVETCWAGWLSKRPAQASTTTAGRPTDEPGFEAS